MRHAIAIAVVVAAAAALAPGRAARAQGGDVERVELSTDDGFTIVGEFHPPRGEGRAPALVLVPMLGHTRESFAPLANLARAAGFAALAIDVRGHGESTKKGGAKASHKSFGPEEWRAAALDLKAAFAWLRAHPRVEASRIGIVGASFGANLALVFAAEEKAVRALVLLSPGIEYRGIRTEPAMKAYGERPVFLAAGGGNDAYSTDTVEVLSALARGEKVLRILDDADHGTRMLGRDPKLGPAIIEWLNKIMK